MYVEKSQIERKSENTFNGTFETSKLLKISVILTNFQTSEDWLKPY